MLHQFLQGYCTVPVYYIIFFYPLTYLYYDLSRFFLVVSGDILLQGYWAVENGSDGGDQ